MIPMLKHPVDDCIFTVGFFALSKWIIIWKSLLLKYWIIWHRPQLCGHSPGLCRYTAPWYFVRKFCELYGCLPHPTHTLAALLSEISVQFYICLVEEDVSMCNTTTTGGTDFSRDCEPYCVTRALRYKHIWDLLAYLKWFEGTKHFTHTLHCPFFLKLPHGNGHFIVLFGSPSPEWLCEWPKSVGYSATGPLFFGKAVLTKARFSHWQQAHDISLASVSNWNYILNLSKSCFSSVKHSTRHHRRQRMSTTWNPPPKGYHSHGPGLRLCHPPTYRRSRKWNEA